MALNSPTRSDHASEDQDRRQRGSATFSSLGDLALYPCDGSSSSDQSSPSNNDHLSPSSLSHGRDFNDAAGSLFFDGAAALSSFFNSSSSGVGIGGSAEGSWSTPGFNSALSPAVMHAASPQSFGHKPSRSGGSVENGAMMRDFWEASPGIPSPMGIDAAAGDHGPVRGEDMRMAGVEGMPHVNGFPGVSSPPRQSTEFSFGSLVAEDRCGPSSLPSPQGTTASASSFSPPASNSIASSAFSFFNPSGIQNALSRFYPSFGTSAATNPQQILPAAQEAPATSFAMDQDAPAFASNQQHVGASQPLSIDAAAASVNLDPSWFAGASLPMSPTTAETSAAVSRESSAGPTNGSSSSQQQSQRSRPNGRQTRAQPAPRTAPQPPVSTPAAPKAPEDVPLRTPSELELAIPAVAYPPRDTPSTWGDTRLMILGIAKEGAKSRVETQVKMSLVLVRPRDRVVKTEGDVAADPVGKALEASVSHDGNVASDVAAETFERVGSWPNLKLPAYSAIKRKARKLIRTGVPHEESLFLEARVTRATEPYDEVFCCANCQARERKRTQRKRDARVRPAQEVSSDEGDKAVAEDDEKRKIVVFNSGEWLDFGTGEITLPARVTCYCRHVKEKRGFRVTITLRDHMDRVVASATTPSIMITDDHKAAAAMAKASKPSSDAEASKQPNGAETKPAAHPGGKAASSLRRASGDASEGNDAKNRRRAGAPYDPSQRGTRSRGGHLSRSPSFAMTPLMTPLTTSKPGSPTQSRLGPFPRTAPASLAPSPSTSDTLPLPPAPTQANGASEASRLSAVADALRSAQMSAQINRAGAHSDGDVQMQDGSTSSQESSPTASGQSGGLALGPSPGLHDDSLESLSSNGPSSATSMDLHNQVDMSVSSQPFTWPPGATPYSPDLAEQFVAAAASGASHQSSAEIMPPPQQPSLASPGWGAETPRNNAGPQPPRIQRLIPCEGPMQGGIEITILGEGFFPGITAVFGDTPAVPTHMWSASTLVCTLPPSASPGPCVVSFRGVPITVQSGSGVQVFTYVDNSDQKLMELALQVVGLQMTGRIQDARNVAMRIVGESGSSSGSTHSGSPSSNGSGASHLTSLAATLATAADSMMSSPPQSGRASRRGSSNDLRAEVQAGNDRSFESIIIRFLTLLDFHDPDVSDREFGKPICLANSQGHTLLHLSVMLGFHKLVAYLLRHGVDVNTRDRNGFTPLHFAALGGKVTITRLLLQAGAGTYVRNAAARTALDLARDRGQVDVVDLFQSFRSRSVDSSRRLSRTYSEASSLASSRRSSFAASLAASAATSAEETSSGGGDSDEAWEPSDDADDDGSDLERRLSRTPSVASLSAGYFGTSAPAESKAENGIPDAVPVSDDDDEGHSSPCRTRDTYVERWLPKKLRKSLPAAKAPSALSKLRLTPSISGITYIPAYTMYGLSAFNPKTWKWSAQAEQPPRELQEKRAGAWRALYAQEGFEDSEESLIPGIDASTGGSEVGTSSASGKTKVSKTQVQAKLARRLGYTPTNIDESVLNAFAYHDSKIRSLKKDKTLWLFWLPILLVALAYATFEAYQYISPRVSELLLSSFAAQRGWTRVY